MPSVDLSPNRLASGSVQAEAERRWVEAKVFRGGRERKQGCGAGRKAGWWLQGCLGRFPPDRFESPVLGEHKPTLFGACCLVFSRSRLLIGGKGH